MTNHSENNKNKLQQNLAALKHHCPHVYAKVEPLLDTVSLRFDPQQTLHISDTQLQITIPRQRRDAALSAIVTPDISEPTHVIIGIGAGDELRVIYDKTQLPRPDLPDYQLPIYLVEPEPTMLIAAMWLHDLTVLLESGRVQWFVGEHAPKELMKYLESHRQALHPTHSLSLWYSNEHPAVRDTLAGINQLGEETGATIDKLQTGINDYYNNVTKAEWLTIVTSGTRPLRILGCTSRFTSFLQYCIRDLLSGFNELGHETRMHIEESNSCRTTKYDLLATVSDFKPDLIIYIDHFRDEYAFLPNNIPFVNWIQDLLPNITQPTRRSLGENDFTFALAPSWIDILGKIPVYDGHAIQYLALGVNKDIYHPIKNSQKTCDVLYISHLPIPAETLQATRDHNANFELNGHETELLASDAISYEQLVLVYMLMTKVLDNLLIDDLWAYNFPEKRASFVSRILSKADIPADPVIVNHFCASTRLANDIKAAIKIRPLRSLMQQGINLHVYGKNWDKYPGFESAWQGIAKNGEPLNSVMNQATICINNSPGISLHMRAMEILGAGVFMLNRRIPMDEADISDHLIEDEEAFFFNNEIDIVSIVKYFLSHEEQR
ncbi:MAG: glycosyltransferase family 1 protein, partial [Gammaproteobacteria bacterium]|nr:glycosyltransferase family 1 protein [Gammaproteobacteria bacterium]